MSIQTLFTDFLGRLDGVVQNGNQYKAFCPVCESGRTSGNRHLYLTTDNGRILLDCKKGCAASEICASIGKTEADLFGNAEKTQPWELLREHIYYDLQGRPAAKKAIYRKSGGDKTGIWYRYEHGRYIKSLEGYKPPMYNLPLLLNTKDGDRIFIVEGEKDADTLVRMGYTATTAPNGAGQAKIPDGSKEYFRGRDIIIMGDRDEPGKKYADFLYNTLRRTGRQVVKVEPAAVWKDVPEKGDISDICQALGEEETRIRLDKAVTSAVAEDLYNRPYIGRREKTDRQGNVTVTHCIIAPALHGYIREHEHYIFARSDAKGSVQRYLYRGGVYRHVSDEEFKGAIRDYMPVPLHSAKIINEVFALFTMDSDRFTQIDELDADENIINFRNGLFCFGADRILPHSPEVLSSIQIPVVYDPDAAKPPDSVFERFIEDLTGGDPDSRQLILEFMGAAVSNVAGYRMKKALFMYGAGDTGKSQCKELLVRLLGAGRFSGIDLDALEERFGTSQLYGKRLAGSSDMGYVTVKGLRAIKLLTGGDSVYAEFKSENAFTYKYKGVLWFCANRMPRFGGDKGDHVYRRIMILPCNNVVANPDPNLLDKMVAEKEYIVRICVDAVKKLIANNYRYTEPDCSREEMKAYRVENDSVLKFLEECSAPCDGKVISDRYTTGQVYKIYKRWSCGNYNFAETKDAFIGTLKENGKGETRMLHGSHYYTAFVPTVDAANEYGSSAGTYDA